ncbi:MAG: DUF1772 domain-containing protein [Rhodomicrobiaceae bacterium]
MPIQLFRWLAILFLTVAVIPAGAHLAALPNKIGLGQTDYFIVQQIYAGWALFGIVEFGAILSTLVFALLLMRKGEPYGYALAAFLLVLANLMIFFGWTFPANKATQNWTVAPANWETLRLQWEYSHAINAVLVLAAFACLMIAVSQHLSRGPA